MKKIISLVLSFFLIISSASVFAEYTPSEKAITVTYNGEMVDFNGAAALNINGFTMVPMRAVFELAGCRVHFDGEEKTVTATKEDYELILTIDSKKAEMQKDGKKVTKELEIAPCIISDRTMVPVRFISESLGFTVNWNPNFKEVVIIDFEKWEEKLKDKSIFGELIFHEIKNNKPYGGSCNAEVDFDNLSVIFNAENTLSAVKNYNCQAVTDADYNIYLKGDFWQELAKMLNLDIKPAAIKDKYVKISLTDFFASQMGIMLNKSGSLWQSFCETIANDKYIYSSTVKNIDDIVNLLLCIKIPDTSKFSVNKSAIIPSKSRVVEFESIFFEN